MKISKNIIVFIMAVIASLSLGACASKKGVAKGQDYKPSDTGVALVADALGRYNDWTTARISGKLHLSSLPVSPSLKIYMKRGEELTISASAILVGEVFRAELTKDSLFIAYKLKKVYCKESGEKLQEIYPTLCEEVQSLLLGRMVVPGKGVLSEKNINKVNIEMEKDLRKVIPSLRDLPIELSLYYILDNGGQLADLTVEKDPGIRVFNLEYDWRGNGGVEMMATVDSKKGLTKVEIDLEAPQWGGKPLSSFKLGRDYKRVSIKDFLKSIR